MQLYEKDVRTANGMLKKRDAHLKTMHSELTDLRRRASLGSASTRSSLGGNSERSTSPPQAQSSHDIDAGKAEVSLSSGRSCESPRIAEACTGAKDEAVADIQLSDHQICLRDALISFYKERQINAESQATNLARHVTSSIVGTSEIELWAAVSVKYGALPREAVAWLSKTLGPMTVVQWPKETVPDIARMVLERIQSEQELGESNMRKCHIEEIQRALQAGDKTLLGVLTFRGCPTELRPEVWRELASFPQIRSLQERRDQYWKLRGKVEKLDLGAAINAFVAAAKTDIVADMKGVWSGEAFLTRPGVADSVAAIAFTTAARYGRHVRGSCEMAALLLFVMAGAGSAADLANAEADAFWCLSQMMFEMRGSIVDNTNQVKQAEHILYLLRLYDPPIADLLRGAGIVALPTTRLGVALCTRAGFGLADCARLWDALLGDPKRFEFCSYVIVAVLLLSRERLLEQRHDAAALAEEVLAAPRRAGIDMVLTTAYSICAFERRCGESSPAPFPPRPGVLDVVAANALEAAQTHLSSTWEKLRRAGRNVARRVAERAAAAPDPMSDGATSSMQAALEVGLI